MGFSRLMKVFMAQILVPFFRRYVDKDKVSDAEASEGATVSASEVTELHRPGSTAQADAVEAGHTSTAGSDPPAADNLDTNPAAVHQEKVGKDACA
jgi:hypothetical protein